MADATTKLNEARSLLSEVQQWREMFEKIQNMPVDEDQGSNTAPAYSWYMYKYRNAFVAPRKTNEPPRPVEVLDEASLDAYISQLGHEKDDWERHTRGYASLLKQPGHVVYHPESVSCPGYCTPSLTVVAPGVASLAGAAVGDRVKENAIAARPEKPEPEFRTSYDSDDSSCQDRWERRDRQERRARRARSGTITSIDDDGGTEVAVQWDYGEEQHCIWCGKKGSFALIYE